MARNPRSIGRAREETALGQLCGRETRAGKEGWSLDMVWGSKLNMQKQFVIPPPQKNPSLVDGGTSKTHLHFFNHFKQIDCLSETI